VSRRLIPIALGGAAALALAAGSGAVASASSACTPAQLRAKMTVIRGSAGAGNIEYRVLLRNASTATCTVSGRVGLRLRGAHGQNLPTHVTAAFPGSLGVLVTLAPGRSAAATLRFSPDVPGPGDSTTGPCEKTAHAVRVTLASPGSGSLVGPISPPTPVCERGRMSETNLSRV
jgi:Protein of unknown function (DUF4232)